MKEEPAANIIDGAQCKVIGGVHAGKSGMIRDIKTGKTGHITITVVQANGIRLKTLAKNVVIVKA
jgi:ribosomal protein S4E